MTADAATIVGREAELGAVTRLLDRAHQGLAVLVLQGEAGIGKTTLWAAAVEEARAEGFRVLGARPAQAESGLAFTGLADLLGGAMDAVDAALPAPQRRALRIALLLDEAQGAAPDERALGVGLLTVLGDLARRTPTLIAIDDVQWLDGPSARALTFVLRRLTEGPLAILLAQRVGTDVGLPLGLATGPPELPVERVVVGPLDAPALDDVLRVAVGASMPRATLQRVHEVSGGNPFFAIELGRALDAHGSYDLGAPLPIPTTLRELVRNRLDALPQTARAALSLVAALPQATFTRVRSAGGRESLAALDAAVDAGVLHSEGERVRFAHPLLASAAYAELSGSQRRAVHRRLADAATDPVERAHHLALATETPDAAIADEIEQGGAAALHRGALLAAADLGAHARRLTPAADAATIRRRAIDEADCRRLLGETVRAREILLEQLGRVRGGPVRAPLLYELARVESWGADWQRASEALRDALEEMDPTDEQLRAATELHFVEVTQIIDDEPRLLAQLATKAAASAEILGDDTLLAQALAHQARAEAHMGMDVTATIERALALEPATAELSPINRPSDYFAEVRGWHDDQAGALATLRGVCCDAEERGEETAHAWTLGRIAMHLCSTGTPDEGLAAAQRGRQLAAQAQQPENEAVMLAGVAYAEAYRGQEIPARRAMEEALAVGRTVTVGRIDRVVRSALGLLELSLGDAAAAHAALEPLVSRIRAAGFAEPGAMRFVPDEVEALIGLGRKDEAAELLDWYEARARAAGRASALAVCARCRGLLACAAGDVTAGILLLAGAARRDRAAAAPADDGSERQDAVPPPLDHARTLLSLGAAQRRAREKRSARESLEAALAEFERVGASLWAARARAELGRIGGRRAAGDMLTPTERRVAALVASGRTNKQAAAELFVSIRSIEANLTRVYAKLGVGSRTELAARREHLGL